MSRTTKTLPSRRDLRLQREALERAELGPAALDAEVRKQAIADRSNESAHDPVEDHSVADQAPVSDIDSNDPPTAEIEPVTLGGSIAAKVEWPPLRSASPRRLVSMAASLASLAMIGSAVAAITFSGAHDASAAQGSPEPAQSAVSAFESSVPDSLKKSDGAADSARYYGLERELSGATVQCDARSGANSLVSAFVDDEEHVVHPMSAGTYTFSSNFGMRLDPFTLRRSMHLGQDYAAPAGTPIYSIANGTVIHVGDGIGGRSSNLIVIAHEINGEKYTSWYVHMYDDGVFVNVGDEVEAGQHIGDVGSKGYSTGPHLHFEIHTGHDLTASTSNVVNPVEMLVKLDAVEISDLC